MKSDVRIDYPGHLNGFATDVTAIRKGAAKTEKGRWRHEDAEFVAEVISKGTAVITRTKVDFDTDIDLTGTVVDLVLKTDAFPETDTSSHPACTKVTRAARLGCGPSHSLLDFRSRG